MVSTGVVYPHVLEWLNALGATNGKRATLEVGAGSGQYAEFFECSKYTSMDVPESWYQSIRRPDVYASADSIPFADETFDVIFNVAAFDYFPNPETCLAEFRRVLAPGGMCLIFNYDLPTLEKIHQNCLDLELKTRASTGHHVFDDNTLKQMAEGAGLSCEKLKLYPTRRLLRDFKLMLRPSNFCNYLLTKSHGPCTPS